MAVKIIFLTATGQNNWTKPADWTDVNTIEVLGSGAGGKSNSGGGGGGGGAYSKSTNVTGLPGTIPYGVGAGGAAGAAGAGSWFNGTSVANGTVSANGGSTTTTPAVRAASAAIPRFPRPSTALTFSPAAAAAGPPGRAVQAVPAAGAIPPRLAMTSEVRAAAGLAQAAQVVSVVMVV